VSRIAGGVARRKGEQTFGLKPVFLWAMRPEAEASGYLGCGFGELSVAGLSSGFPSHPNEQRTLIGEPRLRE
jgi:hypothetical protein